MNGQDLETLAAEYVLATLEESERRDVEGRLTSDATLREKVAEWESRLGGLSENGPSIAPSAGLWTAIDAQISDMPIPGTTTVRAAQGDWRTIAPGCEIKVLFVDHAQGYQSLLMRMHPGAVLPSHDHTMAEECLLLEGEMVIGEARFRAGDFHIAHPGTRHPDIRSEVGALAYIRAELHELPADRPA